MKNEQNRESRLRKRLQRQGYALRKDRARPSRDINHQGGYRIVDPYRNAIVTGERFDLTLDQVDAFSKE